MGKGTDKLYITHSEWSSSDAFSASAGANVSSRAADKNNAPFRRLPYNYCAASLQPFKNPVCTPQGTIFDVEVISAWLEKHPGQNPVDGKPLLKKDLIKLNFARNAESAAPSDPAAGTDLVDPVTYKVFTDNTHIVAIRHGTYANVFAWETVERMNIKAKLWRDLVDDEPFGRADIITLQDPQNAAARNLAQFKYLQDGHEAQPTTEQEEARETGNINAAALGSMGDKVLKAKAAVERARKAREAGADVNHSAGTMARRAAGAAAIAPQTKVLSMVQQKKLAPNSAAYTTGKAAASFTSTGLTPETSGERAVMTDEEYMLKPRRVKTKGFVRMETNLGDMTIELHTDTAPKAVWNMIRLAQKGYYKGMAFHRNIPGFMIQGGDPTGTGKGGTSIWGKNFNDELEGPLTHSGPGILSMANKGKNTNSSQFFILYKAAPHLNRKHTIFGRVATGMEVLAKCEAVPTDGSDRPLNKIFIKDIVVLIDPFEEFLAKQREEQKREEQREEVARRGGNEDDKLTWTGKRIREGGGTTKGEARQGVGKYLKAATTSGDVEDLDADLDVDTWEEPAKKKTKAGGFGNFDSW